MAKKSKNKINILLSLLSIILCIVTIASFFIPTIKTKDEDSTYKFSSLEICFNTEESAKEKAADALKDGNLKLSGKYTTLYTLKATDDTKTPLNTAAWLHFGAMISSLLGAILISLCLLGKQCGGFARLILLVSLALMIGSLISLISFMNVETLLLTIKDVYKISIGIILGLITSMLSVITSFLKINGKSAV